MKSDSVWRFYLLPSDGGPGVCRADKLLAVNGGEVFLASRTTGGKTTCVRETISEVSLGILTAGWKEMTKEHISDLFAAVFACALDAIAEEKATA